MCKRFFFGGVSSPSGPNSSVFGRTETSGYREPLMVISDSALIYKTFLHSPKKDFSLAPKANL